ncbi:MAG: hypothetical protein ACRETE_07035, partial [Stenotrophobium sp.]
MKFSVRPLLAVILVIAAAALAGCITIGNANKPIATIIVPATQAAPEHPLVVVLPGFGADAQDLHYHKLADA